MIVRNLAAGLAALTVAFAGCAAVPPQEVSSVAPPTVVTTPDSAPSTPAATTTSPSASPSPTPTPTATDAPGSEAVASPEKAAAAVSKKTKKEFGNCLKTSLGPGSNGKCARLLQKKLKATKILKGNVTGWVDVRTVNAILNYQRSRGIVATGYVAKKTWAALATNQPVVPMGLPQECKTKGVVLCVDQAHRRLMYVKKGQIKRIVKIRTGGYNFHPKKKTPSGQPIWRNFPTANGTYRVYTKHVSPPSDNYGAGAMPYSVIFDPNMYVHYSSGFANAGYASSSHGCVNVGSFKDAVWLFKHTPIGARVHIFG